MWGDNIVITEVLNQKGKKLNKKERKELKRKQQIMKERQKKFKNVQQDNDREINVLIEGFPNFDREMIETVYNGCT